MIVAITGGTGFIGRHLIARHCARGDQVRFLTRHPPHEQIAGATAHIGDLCASPDDLRRFAGGADVLYHCAAELHREAEMSKTNVQGTANLLAAAGDNLGRWIQLSSTGVYGSRSSGDVDEDTEVMPANAYETTKSAADALLFDAAMHRNFPCVVVRPSNVYGTDMPNQSLFHLIRMIDRGLFFFIGRPGAVANYVAVENVIDALELCATAKLPENGRSYIVSDHRTIEELVRVFATALGKNAPRHRLPEALVRAVARVGSIASGFPLTPSRVDALTNRTIFRINRITTELGYKNRISMESGMSELARHWKARTAGA